MPASRPHTCASFVQEGVSNTSASAACASCVQAGGSNTSTSAVSAPACMGGGTEFWILPVSVSPAAGVSVGVASLVFVRSLFRGGFDKVACGGSCGWMTSDSGGCVGLFCDPLCLGELSFIDEETAACSSLPRPEAILESVGDAAVDVGSGMCTAEVSCNVYSSDRVDKIDNKSAGASGHTRRM